MGGNGEAGLDLASVLVAAEVGAPVEAVDAVAAELADRLGALEVSFLVADYSGDALVRLSRAGTGAGRRSRGEDAATTVPLSGSVYEQTVRSQRVRVLAQGHGAELVAPVTNRGDVIGVLELRLPGHPDADTVEQVAAVAHVLGYVVVANHRFTDSITAWSGRRYMSR